MSIIFAGDLAAVRISGVSARRELTVKSFQSIIVLPPVVRGLLIVLLPET